MSTDFNSEKRTAASTPMPHDDEAMWALLSVYLDGETTPAEAALVEKRLRTDPAFARKYALLQRTSAAARALPEIDPPTGLRAAIFAATIYRPTPMGRVNAAWGRLRAASAPRPARLALAGGALAAAALAFLVIRPGPRQPLSVVRPAPGPLVAVLPPPVVTPAPPPDFESPARTTSSRAEATQHPIAPEVQNIQSPPRMADNNMRIARDLTDGERLAAANLRASSKANGNHTYTQNRRASQRPDSYERPKAEVALYSPLPRMDQQNQRDTSPMIPATYITMDNGTSRSAAPIDNMPMAQPSTAPTAPAAGSAPATAKVIVHISQLPQPPPDTRRFLPIADIRREMEARNLGFNNTTLEGIRRGEARITLIGGRF